MLEVYENVIGMFELKMKVNKIKDMCMSDCVLEKEKVLKLLK